jgi:hypothetical protein
MRRILSVAAWLLLCTVSVFAQQPSEITGTISTAGTDCTTATRCVVLPLGAASGTGLITVGTFTGTIAVEVSPDNSTWTAPLGGTTSITTAGTYSTSLQGARWLRVRASALSANTPAIVLSATSAPFYGSVAVTGTTTVSGSVTVNAGTNLNTSTLALETGGNLASIKTDVDKIPSQGQALAAASMPVVLPATQITTLTPLSTVTANLGTLNGAATAAGVSALEVTQGSTTSGQSGILTQGAVTTAAPTYTTAQTAPLSLDTSGNLRVAVTGGGSNAAASATGSAVPASAGYTGVNVGGTLRGVTGLSTGSLFPMTVAIVDGSGTQVTAFSGSGGTSSNFGSATPSAGTAAGYSDGTNMQSPRVFDLDSGAGTQYGLGINLRRSASGGSAELIGSSTSATSVPVVIASDQAAVPASQSGTWTVQPGNTANSTAWLFAGGKTHNNATPGATNIGALTMLANAAAPTFTETDLTLGSVDLHGSQRITPLDSGGTTMTDTTAHAVKVLSVDSTGANITPTTLATDDTALGTKTSITGGVMMGYAKAAAPTDVSADGDAASLWMLRNGSPVVNIAAGGSLIGATSNALDVNIKSGASSGVQYTQDAALTVATSVGTAIAGRASAAAPANVSADDDAVLAWYLRSGAAAVQPTFGGVLQGTGNGTAGTSTPRVTIASDNTAFSVNAVESGTWNITNVSGTVSLPTGASTLAEQQTQTTALQLIDNLPNTQGSTTSGQSGVLQLGAVTTAAPTYTTAQSSPISLQTDGSQRVAVTNTVTVGSHAVTNAGTFATQSAITAASGSIASGAIASGAVASGAVVDGAVVTMGAKTDAKSTATDTTSVSEMSVLKQISASVQAPPSQAPTPSAASGDALTECVVLSAASTNSTACKASAGNLYSYELYNTTTTVYYLRLYNLAAGPTCSSATGFIRSIPIPPAAAAGGVGGMVSNGTFGVAYSTGIAYCLTGGSSSTDNTNAATGIFGSIKVK